MLRENALVTLAEAKEFVDIPSSETSYDSRIERLINTTSARVENYCSRKFRYQEHALVIDGTRNNAVLLTHYPVVSISSVIMVRDKKDFSDGEVIETDKYRVEQGGILRLLDGFITSRGVQNIQIKYFAGYELPDQSATGAQPVPDDLQEACLFLVQHFYEMAEDRRIGITSKSRNGQNISFKDGMPEFVEEILLPYTRMDFPHFEAPPGMY